MELEGFAKVSDIVRSGVYALVHQRKVVYVGKSKCMLGRIAAHRSVWSSQRRGNKVPSWLPMRGVLFDEVFIRPCRVDQMDDLEAEMIALHRPRYNTQLKPPMSLAQLIAIPQGEPIRRRA